MMIFRLCLVSVVFFGFSHLAWGDMLSDSDIRQLKKSESIQHLLYETYTQTENGPTSVFGYYFDSYFSKNGYFSLGIFGAVQGSRGGYGIAAFGLGYRLPITDKLSLDFRALTGSGGGGGVPAGGGFAVEAVAGLSYECFPNFFLESRYGILQFPTGSLNTTVYSLGVAYRYFSVSL